MVSLWSFLIGRERTSLFDCLPTPVRSFHAMGHLVTGKYQVQFVARCYCACCILSPIYGLHICFVGSATKAEKLELQPPGTRPNFMSL
jgi:hypothetical protein